MEKIEAFGPEMLLMLKFVTTSHPASSVTVRLYDPAAIPEAEDVVEPVDHE
jgi:hypothetical protein